MITTLEDAVDEANRLHDLDGEHRVVMYRWGKDPIKPRFGEWGGKWLFSIRKGNPIVARGNEKKLNGQFRLCYCTARPEIVSELKKRHDRFGNPY